MTWLYVLIGIAAVIVLWWIITSNGFKKKDLKTKESLSGIEVALTKRYDTLVKMKDVAKGYADHEKEVLTDTVRLRKGMSAAELNEASNAMNSLEKSINVVAENYPALRAADVFIQLQEAVRDAEEHLQAARRLYNSTATSYNTDLVIFPKSIVANAMKLEKHELFVADEAKRADVDMKF